MALIYEDDVLRRDSQIYRPEEAWDRSRSHIYKGEERKKKLPGERKQAAGDGSMITNDVRQGGGPVFVWCLCAACLPTRRIDTHRPRAMIEE